MLVIARLLLHWCLSTRLEKVEQQEEQIQATSNSIETRKRKIEELQDMVTTLEEQDKKIKELTKRANLLTSNSDHGAGDTITQPKKKALEQ